MFETMPQEFLCRERRWNWEDSGGHNLQKKKERGKDEEEICEFWCWKLNFHLMFREWIWACFDAKETHGNQGSYTVYMRQYICKNNEVITLETYSVCVIHCQRLINIVDSLY